jgi:hypothetical protein
MIREALNEPGLRNMVNTQIPLGRIAEPNEIGCEPISRFRRRFVLARRDHFRRRRTGRPIEAKNAREHLEERRRPPVR